MVLEPQEVPQNGAPMGGYGGLALHPLSQPQAMSQLFQSQFRGFPMTLGAFSFAPGLLAHQGLRFGSMIPSDGGASPHPIGPASPSGSAARPAPGGGLDRRLWPREQRPPPPPPNDKNGESYTMCIPISFLE